MNTLVIMPTYREVETLRLAVEALFNHNENVDLLIVDDNSPDGTGQLADTLAAMNPRIKVLHREAKQGLGPAYIAGFKLGAQLGYEFMVEMDADGSHRAQDLPKLLAEASANDLVIGSRWIPGGRVVNWPLHRKAISRLGNLYVRIMLGTKVRDMTAGFRVYRTSFLMQLDLGGVSAAGYSFQVEMAWKALLAGARTLEVPITFIEREHGRSKMTSGIVLEALRLVTVWGFARLFGR